jgi:hypothetical protein
MFLAVAAGSLQYYLGELKSVTDLGAFFLPTVGDIDESLWENMHKYITYGMALVQASLHQN